MGDAVTTFAERSSTTEPVPVRPYPPRTAPRGAFLYKAITTTDPKLLGIMYVVTTFSFF